MSERCHICGEANLVAADGYGELARVTSDSRPWPAGGRLVVCRHCGSVTKPVDATFLDDADRIYRDYDLYHLTQEIDQTIFTATGPRSRSGIVVERLAATGRLPAKGKLLDVGCGRGAFLAEFAHVMPGWALCGLERAGASGADVLAIPGAQFCTGDLETMPNDFDLIAMAHVLEHIPDPRRFLTKIAARLGSDGLLFIQVPNLSENPFDVLVADHCTHFNPDSLTWLLEAAGFELLVWAADWVPKEISVLSCYTGHKRIAADGHSARRLETVGHLARLASEAKACAEGARRFGIFGTAIAGVWLDTQLQNVATFFVDEDVNRQGCILLGRPVIAPGDIPAGATVYVPVPPPVAERIVERLSRPGVDVRYPRFDK